MRFHFLKIVPIFLIVVLIFFQCRLWFQSGGLLDMRQLKKQLSLQMQENDKLKKRNEMLMQQVERLQKNPDTIEGHARGELGMVKKGETFYQVVR